MAILTLPFNTIAIDAQQAATQIKSKIVNKVISTTEGFINQQANEFVNNFGKGRTSITIKSIESDEPSYSIDTIQPISEFNKDIKKLTFVQGSLASGENEGDRRNTINLGLGKRILVEEDKAIIGANVFVDYETSSKHKRTSLGLEYQRSNFSATANKYWALSDKITINGNTEEALGGHDIKLTGQAPYAPWATIKGTHYFWDETTGDNITGNILGIQIEVSPSVSFELGSENSSVMNRTAYAELTAKLPFNGKEKLVNFVLDDAPFRADADMNGELLAMVKRSNKIKQNGVIRFKGLTYRMVTSPDTGRIWLDRNLGATQVATSSTDSASYGDLYQWGRAADGHQLRTSVTTSTLATTITPRANAFVTNNTSPYDWNSADSSGASRASAWADGGANDICPVGFDVPTEVEITADITNATTTQVVNSATAFSSFLKIPVAGRHYRTGSLDLVDSSTGLWSRSAHEVNGRLLYIHSNGLFFSSDSRANGFSVRCIKDL
ncbi:inverse autotransporter beta domain-containing protein [Candidatus Thioglobus sp.]|nr:inverse autotransporter beta domain-containing protein [Candidatus Thioglobus sp.]